MSLNGGLALWLYYDKQGDGPVWFRYSTDFGKTWVDPEQPPPYFPTAVNMQPVGGAAFALMQNGAVWVSTADFDFFGDQQVGKNWEPLKLPKSLPWGLDDIAVSPGGNELVVVGTDGPAGGPDKNVIYKITCPQ